MPRRTKIDTSTPGIHHRENGDLLLEALVHQQLQPLAQQRLGGGRQCHRQQRQEGAAAIGLEDRPEALDDDLLLSNFFFRIQAEAHQHEHHERIEQAAFHRPEDHFGQAEAQYSLSHYQHACQRHRELRRARAMARSSRAKKPAAPPASRATARIRPRRPSPIPATRHYAGAAASSTIGSSLPSRRKIVARRAAQAEKSRPAAGARRSASDAPFHSSSRVPTLVQTLPPSNQVRRRSRLPDEALLHAGGGHEPGRQQHRAARRQQAPHAQAASRRAWRRNSSAATGQRDPAAAAAGHDSEAARPAIAPSRRPACPAGSFRMSIAAVMRQQRQQQRQVAEGDRIDQAARAVDAQHDALPG
jgi:hypothetical protein